MAIEKGKLQLERSAYQNFQRLFNRDGFGTQRYGQAFYDHFKLGRLVDQTQLKNVYEKDGDHAKRLISEIFKFN